MLVTSGVSLHYNIRKDLPLGHQFAKPAKALVHKCPLNGLIYAKDNQQIFGIIKQGMVDTPNWDWIKSLNGAQPGSERCNDSAQDSF